MFSQDFYGSTFKWFIGVVKDGEQINGRVRVRIFGIHPFESDNIGDGPAYARVSNGDLPWATVVLPLDSGTTSHNLHVEDWVVGFFADPVDCQQPVIIGRINKADGSTGSNFYGDERNRIAGAPTTPAGGQTGAAPGTGSPSSGTGPTAVISNHRYYYNIPGNTNPQRAFNLLATFLNEEHGVPLATAQQLAAGIVASLAGESGQNLNPEAFNSAGGGIGAYGIAQWRGSRQRGLHEMCTRGDFTCQLNFLITELGNRGHGVTSEGTHARSLNALLGVSTAADAAISWTVNFEAPHNAHAEGQRRARNAQSYFDALQPNFQRATLGR